MGRRAKPAKVKAEAKRPPARKSPKTETVRGRDLEQRLAEALKREAETREQQAATAKILRLIASSPDDAQPVFDAIAVNAVRLCDAERAVVVRYDGALLHVAAHHNVEPEAVRRLEGQYPLAPDRRIPMGRAVLDGAVVHVPDFQAAVEFSGSVAREFGARSQVSIPLLCQGRAIGAIGISRWTPGPFSDRQIALLQTFADQAVIAIENVRLFKELEEKNRALTHSLEQQTATSEILQVISQSPTDMQPVFETIARSVVRLCQGLYTYLSLFDGQLVTFVAFHNVSPAALEILRRRFPSPPTRGSSTGRAILTRAVVHIPDVSVDADYKFSDLAQADAYRSILAVPMLREGIPIGAITVGRQAAFTESQIALVKTFADQAVIAIENVHLFTELQHKNEALTRAHAQVTEALEQQTATSEILRVISSSPTDVQPVFNTIVASAVRLCGAQVGSAFHFDGELSHLVAHHNYPPEVLEIMREMHPRPAQRDQASGRAILTRAVVQIEDTLADLEYRQEIARHWRSVLAVPMLRGGQPIGAITVVRAQTGAFSSNQVELLQTFADQAVIAIENVRLFTELQARTGELTRSVGELRALGEVGQAISSTLDLQTVLSTIVARATQLAGADAGIIYEYDAEREVFEPRATEHLEPEIVEVLVTAPVRKGEGATGQLAISPEAVHLPDTQLDSLPSPHHARGAFAQAGYRALLAVPLLREHHLIGGLTVVRKMPGEFPRETIGLLQTFATQSALAIQNARLFREIEDKSRQLEAASQHKSEFLANMSHELRTPLNAIIGFSEVLADAMFGEVNEKQAEYLRDIQESGQHLLSLINDILDLSKIEAGRMELEPADFDLPGAIDNALTLVRERAGRRGITLGREIDERVGTIRADERKVKQVLLNLLSNAIKFTPEGGRIDVRATVNADIVEVSVADTGVGIAPEDQDAVFEEFRQVGTADKRVEGTGLGLALSRKFVELHGGRIWVKSQVGTGSTFTFTIPLRREPSDRGGAPTLIS